MNNELSDVMAMVAFWTMATFLIGLLIGSNIMLLVAVASAAATIGISVVLLIREIILLVRGA